MLVQKQTVLHIKTHTFKILRKRRQLSTVDINNKVVSYRPTIHSNSANSQLFGAGKTRVVH